MKSENVLSVLTIVAAVYFCCTVISDAAGSDELLGVILADGVVMGLLAVQVIVLRWKYV